MQEERQRHLPVPSLPFSNSSIALCVFFLLLFDSLWRGFIPSNFPPSPSIKTKSGKSCEIPTGHLPACTVCLSPTPTHINTPQNFLAWSLSSLKVNPPVS
ncbi:hypothetical protein LX32DRAFT_646040 [Colletotrichum zoysiae]|uniref:Uncharacterized protein n=1 Tax=Colletotrichum zoysiae TaxID=1216348 RepID=A0AAD9H3Q4_9PEZI|nr:hypothetical protein LX32DRAFT_646040 [Colletotrichum zoysiae]